MSSARRFSAPTATSPRFTDHRRGQRDPAGKEPADVLDAFARIHCAHPATTLAIVGSGPEIARAPSPAFARYPPSLCLRTGHAARLSLARRHRYLCTALAIGSTFQLAYGSNGLLLLRARLQRRRQSRTDRA